MKKIIAFLLAFSMVLAFAACDIGNDVSRPENSGASTEVSGEAGNESEASEAAIATDADGMRLIPIRTNMTERLTSSFPMVLHLRSMQMRDLTVFR